MHEASVNHRDIKSANIFTKKDGTVKIGDFSAARFTNSGVLSQQIGSPLYASPEVWNGKVYDFHSDIWSLGVVLYEMTCLHHPFVGNNMDQLRNNVVQGKYKPVPSHFSDDLKKVIMKCLNQVAAARPSMADILLMPATQKWGKKIFKEKLYAAEADKWTGASLIPPIIMPDNLL